MAVAALAALAAGLNAYLRNWTAAVAVGLLAVVAVMWTRTAYELTEDSLRLRLGYRRVEIPLRAIRCVEHSTRPGATGGVKKWPSFALSFSNYWVIHAHDGTQPVDVAFSPSDKMLAVLAKKVQVLPKEGPTKGRPEAGPR